MPMLLARAQLPVHRLGVRARPATATLETASRLASSPPAWVGVLGAVLALTLPAAPGDAQARVRVRAETRIELRVSPEAGQVQIDAVLRDDLGAALADRPLELRVLREDGTRLHQSRDVTDAAGQHRARIRLPVGVYRVAARFEGDDGHERAEVAQALDLTRAHLRLNLRVPNQGRLDLDDATHRFRIEATSTEGGAGLAVSLESELGRALGEGVTDVRGELTLEVPSELLGPASSGRLIVRSPGDGRRSAAQTEVPVVRFRPSRLTLEVERGRGRSADVLWARGRLDDSVGPIPGRAVGIFDGDRHLRTVLTDEDGHYSTRLDMGEAREVAIWARFDADAPWRTDARTEALLITLEPAAPISWPWFAAPLLVVALFIAWRARRGRAPADHEVAEARWVGVRAGQAKAPRPAHFELAGRVLDADAGEAIEGVRVEIRLGSVSLECVTDRAGRFRIDALPKGPAHISFEKAGYRDVESEATLPHRGEWSDLVVKLESLRALAMARYRPVAEALAPSRAGVETPREILERAERERRPRLDSLTTRVEVAVYGPEPPSETEIGEIDRQATAFKDDIAPKGVPPPERHERR